MAQHFIYVNKDGMDSDQLFQGDVLLKNKELLSVLSEYHPHYATQDNYQYFLVLTQSCDIHKRNDKPPSSPYINIAAVRPLERAVWQIARKYQAWWQIPTNTLSDKDFNKMINLTASLLDNNIPNYFYLHEDTDLGINGKNCAFLSLSLAIRMKHYNKCLKAKIAQLRSEFQAKLGWLVGSMYSKVGTKEWNDHYATDVYKEASNVLKAQFATIDSVKIRKCLKELEDRQSIDKYSPSEIIEHISNRKLPSKIDIFREQAKNEIATIQQLDQVSSKDKVINLIVASLISNPEISRLLK